MDVPTKSFNLSYLYLIAFFGGAIPVIGIAGTSAKWLRVNPSRINAMTGLCFLVIFAKMILVSLYLNGTSPITDDVIKFGYRIACLLVAHLYLAAVKEPYAQHLMAQLPFEPMKRYVIKYLLLGILIEAGILLIIASSFGSL